MYHMALHIEINLKLPTAGSLTVCVYGCVCTRPCARVWHKFSRGVLLTRTMAIHNLPRV